MVAHHLHEAPGVQVVLVGMVDHARVDDRRAPGARIAT